jgi:hypothetical protein
MQVASAPWATRWPCYGLAAVLLFLAGCSKTPDELLQQALTAEKAAQTALTRDDPKAARHAAEKAGQVENRLRKLAEADGPDRDRRQQLFRRAQAAARLAREHADLAEQQQQRWEKLNGLKLRVYRNARSSILTTLLPPMAAAAERAGNAGTNQLSTVETGLANGCWNLVSILGDRSTNADGTPDWAGAASDLRNWSTNQPPEFSAFLALAFVALGQKDFALAEMESVNPATLRATNELAIYHGGRAILYAVQGWNQLAAPEAEVFSQHAQLLDGPVSGPQLVALFHAVTACEASTRRDFIKMDEAIAQSIRAWPDNPVATFLTGEKLAANGEWEKAAESLEARVAGTEDEWIAKQFAQRARELRDGKGSTKALVLDARFLIELAAHATVKTAKNSAAAKRLEAWIEEAKQFGQKLREKVPLTGQ